MERTANRTTRCGTFLTSSNCNRSRHSLWLLDLLILHSLASGFLTVMTRHWLKALIEDRTLLHLLPIMQHLTVLHGASDLVSPTWYDFSIVLGYRLLDGFLAGSDGSNRIHEMGNIAYGMIQTLSTVWRHGMCRIAFPNVLASVIGALKAKEKKKETYRQVLRAPRDCSRVR